MANKKRFAILGAFASIAIALLLNAQNAFAYTDIGTLTNISKSRAIRACYENDALPSTAKLSDFNSRTGIVKSGTPAPIPITSSNPSGTVDCQSVINSAYGSLPSDTDFAGIARYYTDLGYTKTSSGSTSQYCFYYTIGSSGKRTNSLCLNYSDRFGIETDVAVGGDGGDGDYFIEFDITSGWVYYRERADVNVRVDLFSYAALGGGSKSNLESAVESGASKIPIGATGVMETGGEAYSDVYSLTDKITAANKFFNAHGGGETVYSPYDQHSYYKYYLMTYWGFTQDEDNCSKSPGADKIPFKTAPDDITYCGLKDKSGARISGSSADGGVTAVHTVTSMANGFGYLNNDNGLTPSTAISAINALNYSNGTMISAGVNGLGPAPCVVDEEDCGPSSTSSPTPTPTPNDPGDDYSIDKCYEVAGVVGWIVCPALTFMEEMLSTAYDNLIEPLLMADPNNVLGDKTQEAWGYFRDFANIVFAFLLLLVVLSQVTGYGIDNYGIKRMLPKLIIGAILINFSFILCKLALDVANIVGSSINNMLSSVATGSTGSSFGALIGNAASTLLDIAVSGGILAGVAVATGGWTFLLPVLLAFITAVISILFMFVLLGVRQAGIIVLAVMAPVALVLYVLPNTQKWSQRWTQAFGGLLLAYPLIGAMVGGCHLASRVILGGNQEDFVLNLLGLMLSVVPYFFIPSLLRSSMSAMGNVGARISGLGQRLGHGAAGLAGNAVRQTGGYQASLNRQAAIRADRVRRSENRGAQRTIDRLNAIKANGGQLSARQERDLARAQRTRTSNIRADAADTRAAAEYERLSSPAGQAALQAGLAAEAENAAIKDETAILDGGGYDYSGGHVDANDLNSLEQALAYETSQEGEQNIARIMALKQTLEQRYAKKGMDAVARVMDSGNMKGEGARRIVNSIASDGNYKNQARSVFAAANQIKGQAAFQASGAVAGGQISNMRTTGGAVGSMKSENIGQMTDDEFSAFVSQSGNANADIRNSAGRMAQEALDDDTIRSQLNSDQIRDLENLARATGQVSSQQRLAQDQGQVLNIQQQQLDVLNQLNQRMQGQGTGSGQSGQGAGGGLNPDNFPNGIGDEGYSTAPPPHDNE